ncbi:hypothetical protein GCM10023199_41510 [Actinomycetospora chibensis]
MSTPSKPDDPDHAPSSETSGKGGVRTSTEEPAPETESPNAESTTRVQAVDEDRGSADRDQAEAAGTEPTPGESSPTPDTAGESTSSSGGSAGPPPPWQRGGAATGPPSGPMPSTGRPGPRPAGPPTPAGGQPRAGGPPGGAHPPSGPFPRPGGPGPQGGPGGPGNGRPPQEGMGTPAGGITAAVRTSAPTGTGRPGGTGDGGGAGQPASSGIDAPTNQLSPEQLGLRGRESDEPRREPDDVAELAAGRPRSSKAPRRASLQVRRFDPWSVLKLALVLGVALFFVWMFAVGVLYAVLDGMGVWAQLNGTYQDLTSDSGGGGELITAGGVFGVAAVIGVVNIILFTALASVSAFIYNISADVAGGIEVTLSERD